MTHCLLPSRSIIRISGADARTLLQGIITNDITLLERQPAIFSAMLSPQGKFQHDFFITTDGDDLLLDTEQSLTESLIKKLTMYRLRSAVKIADETDLWQAYAGWNEAPPKGAFNDPRHRDLGWRFMTKEPLNNNTDFTSYDRHRLQLGVPDGSRDTTERTLIMENGYDQLHAIAFTKGCYVGQEVTARMHYRHALPKCLFKIEGSQPLPQSGTAIMASEQTLGEMRSSCGGTGLALIRLSEWKAAQAANLTAQIEGHNVQLTLPNYMREKVEKTLSSSD